MISSPTVGTMMDNSLLASDFEDTVEDITPSTRDTPVSDSNIKLESKSDPSDNDDYIDNSDESDATPESPFSVDPLHRQIYLRTAKGTISPSWLHAYELEYPIKLLIITKATVKYTTTIFKPGTPTKM
jgi:hypothetical protein